MESTARVTGYACALAILLFIIWGGGILLHEALHPARIIRVRFPELGTLMVEDPVAQDGVPIGRVRSITLQNDTSLVEIELFRTEFIASDARFIDFNHSLMGARMVVLTQGHSTLPMDESQVQDGIFADGVAESIHRVQALLHFVTKMRVQLNQLFTNPSGALSPENFRRLEDNAQKLTALAQRIELLGTALQGGIESLTHMEATLQTGFQSLTPGINKTEGKTDTLLSSALSAEESADTVLTSAEKLLTSVQDTSGALHALVYDPAVYNELKSSLNFLEQALHTYQSEGLSHVVGWRNLHFSHAKSP